MLVTDFAQPNQRLFGNDPNATFTLDRLNHDRGSVVRYGGFNGVEIGRLKVDETWHVRAKAIQVLRITSRRQRGEGAAVEGALKRDNLMAVGIAADVMIPADGFDRAFAGFRARVTEKDNVREGRRNKRLGNCGLAGDIVEI